MTDSSRGDWWRHDEPPLGERGSNGRANDTQIDGAARTSGQRGGVAGALAGARNGGAAAGAPGAAAGKRAGSGVRPGVGAGSGVRSGAGVGSGSGVRPDAGAGAGAASSSRAERQWGERPEDARELEGEALRARRRRMDGDEAPVRSRRGQAEGRARGAASRVARSGTDANPRSRRSSRPADRQAAPARDRQAAPARDRQTAPGRERRPYEPRHHGVPQFSTRIQRPQSPQVLHPGRNEHIPQIRDTVARRGGWNLPSLGRVGGAAPHERELPRWLPVVGALLAVALLVLAVRGVVGCVAGLAPAQEAPEAAATTQAADIRPASATATGDQPAYTTLDAGRTTASGNGRMSFSAVGDNLANSNLLTLADGWAGGEGDGAYDFSPFYAEVKPFLQSQCDVSFINQETTLGGTDRYGYLGYPSFNTPDSMADAVADAGWRVVGLDTNHTYDTWVQSIEHAQGVWAAHEGLVTCGSYTSADDRQTVRMVECNGIRLAVLAYCYGQNGYEQSDLPNDYYAVPWDAEAMRDDVARARKVADAVVVYVHAGTEYKNEPNDQQKEIAQACADAGVDLMIGSHAHVIQPVAWLQRSGGGKMLAVYGLGDFLSGYRDYPETILSGMFTCDFVRVEGDAAAGDNVGPGGIAVENPTWHPLVEHMAGTSDVVRFVKGYSDADAEANELLSTLDNPRAWLVDETRRVLGDTIAIDL